MGRGSFVSEEFKTVWAEPLTQFCQRVFEKMGIPPGDAATTAEVLVLADLRGIDSHGLPGCGAIIPA